MWKRIWRSGKRFKLLDILRLPTAPRSRMPIDRDDYEYDVFFSYKRDPLVQDWVAKVVGRLRYWLSQELGGKPSNIFWDSDGIDIGDRWPDVLRSAMKRSRCLVALWSPMYFQSGWCVSEWTSFRERERQLGLATHGLIAPVRYHDGEHFPREAQAVQWIDFAPYASTVKAFWETSHAVEFETRIKELAKSVASIVRRAPEYDEWPVVEAAPAPPGHVDLRRL
jgi:hypothetical protein